MTVTFAHLFKNKLSELKEVLISELGRCCKEHGIDKKTLEHFVLADEVHNALTRGLNFKLSENEDIFNDFAEELLLFSCSRQFIIKLYTRSSDMFYPRLVC